MRKDVFFIGISLAIILISFPSSAQQDVLFQKRFGTDTYDNYFTIRAIPDDGCLIGMVDADYIAATIIKYDNDGIEEWSINPFPDSWNRLIYDIEIDLNGQYLIAANENSSVEEGLNGVLLKANTSGEIVLQTSIGGPAHQYFKAVKSLPEGGSVVAGYRTDSPYIAADYAAWVTRFDAEGNIVWDTHFDDTLRQVFNDVVVAGDYVYCVGSTNIGSTDTTQGYDIMLGKVALETGELEWIKTYGGNFNDEGNKIAIINDKLFLVGSTESSNLDVSLNHGWYDVWVIEADLDGNLLWEKTYGGTYNEYGNGIGVIGDQLVIGAVTSSSDGDIPHKEIGWDYWVFSIDQQGNILTNETYGGNGTDWLQDLDIGIDSSVWVIGYTNSTDILNNQAVGFSDGWILKLGGLMVDNDDKFTDDFKTVKVYPNPAGDYFRVQSPEQMDGADLLLYDITGKVVLVKSLNSVVSTVDVRNLPGGLYLYSIQDKEGVVIKTGKIINYE